MSPGKDRTEDEVDTLIAEAIEARQRRLVPREHATRRIDTAMWGLVLTVMIQLITVVWFAASLNGAVTELHDTTRELTTAVSSLRDSQAKTNERVQILDALLNERTGRKP